MPIDKQKKYPLVGELRAKGYLIKENVDNRECSMKSVVIQRYANREVRIGFQDLPARSRDRADGEGIRRTERMGRCLDTDVSMSQSASGFFCYRDKDSVSYIRLGEGYERVSTYVQSQLDIIAKVQQENRDDRKRQGDTRRVNRRAARFTSNARHRILEAGAIIDQSRRDGGESLMVTLTLPGSSAGAYKLLAESTGYIANRILQPIRRTKRDIQWFYVWELQERGALHMHLCLSSVFVESMVAIAIDIVQTWYRCLLEISESSGICLFSRERDGACTVSRNWQFDIQKCKRSVAAYFAKYVSKGGSKKIQSGAVESVGPAYAPKRWWGMSRKLVRAVNEARVKVEIYGVSEDDGVQMLRALDSMLGGYDSAGRRSYNFELSSRTGGKQGHLGWGFREIYYFSDTAFANVTEELPGIINAVMQYSNTALLKGDIAKVLHTPLRSRSMQWNGSIAIA